MTDIFQGGNEKGVLLAAPAAAKLSYDGLDIFCWSVCSSTLDSEVIGPHLGRRSKTHSNLVFKSKTTNYQNSFVHDSYPRKSTIFTNVMLKC